ncbi:hypothetical protein JCGZ_10782 [Jatropha curcas]|uniref:Glabrous enhancer-binding protein-like DBD domain-containing protein n=1 Tax=Jatropha curcas TaxID=180498 RepID=A0A067LQ42_JATCU|nr:hypothetical protein JCGZ_10782 [Jatropha curcas]
MKKREAQEDMTVVLKSKKKRTRDVEDDDVDYIYEEKDKNNAKPKQSNRLWNNEDETVLLSAMINLGIKSGDSNNVDRLYDHVIKDLHCTTVSKSQLTEKVHRLRKKYKKNLVRGGRDSLSGKHEIELFDLCHQLWEKSSQILAITAISAPAGGGNPKPISDLFCMNCLTKMARVPAKFEWDLDDTEHLEPKDQEVLMMMKESQIADMAALKKRLWLVKTIVEEKMKSFQI